jgi:hypothetical protein
MVVNGRMTAPEREAALGGQVDQFAGLRRRRLLG